MKIFNFIHAAFFTLVSSVFVSLPLFAQVIPDETLGSENSTVNSIDELDDRIEGGAIRGENLFHSFEKFGIPEGMEVYFANPKNITNIFSRITGNNISEISGTLGVEGPANLFLINPNGIVFGENARIDVGGSFIATTAEKIHFEDGKVLNVRSREKPLLTWNAPIGLGLEKTSGEIVVRGEGNNILFTSLRTFVEDDNLPLQKIEASTGEGFALLGNNVRFEGGVLDILAKIIDIGSVQQGKVGLSILPSLKLDYSQVDKFNNISLIDFALIDIDGSINTETNINGNFIDLQNGSLILTSDLGSNPQKAAELNVNAQQQLLLRGATTNNPPSNEGLYRGTSGIVSQNTNINTSQLILESGGGIGATFQEGVDGKVKINSSDSIRIAGFIPLNPTLGFSSIGINTTNNESSGSIDIATKNLSIVEGGSIISTAINSSNSGEIRVKADSITIEGILKEGNLISLSSIASSAFGLGNSGSIDIITNNLTVLNGGAISTSSFSNATAGNINIVAKNSINIDSFLEKNFIIQSDIAFSTIGSLVSQIEPEIIERIPGFLRSEGELPTGNAGNISLTTNSLTISDRASVTVQNDGAGNAGSIEIDANSINLNTEGSISAAALLGEGGNIKVNSDRTTLNNSLISAEAGGGSGGNIEITSDRITTNNSDITAASLSQRGGNLTLIGDRFIFKDSNFNASAEDLGNGGNVTIDADTVLGINSDITATAERGDGGNVTIDADGVLGFTEATAIDNNGISEVDVTSRFGTDGVVVINNPLTTSNDPIIALNEIPRNNLLLSLAGDCYNNEGEPLVTDSIHEDLPEAPDDYLDYSSVIDDEAIDDASLESPKPTELDTSYYPADTAIQTEDGRVYLVNKEQLNQLEKSGCLQVHGDLDD